MNPYTSKYYAAHSEISLSSARVVVPLVVSLLNPRSVVDFGCGIGTWLRAFVENGVSDYLGIDGDHVPREQLQIAEQHYRPGDLCSPVVLDRSFDLACSLEVAEHLPENAAPSFVASLAGAAPAILFSAAIPHQGGVGHVNEQWQDYWRNLFDGKGYVGIDPIRPRVWGDPKVAWWYQQNIVLYVKRDYLVSLPALQAITNATSLNLVHPTCYDRRQAPYPTLSQTMRMLPRIIFRSLKFHLGR